MIAEPLNDHDCLRRMTLIAAQGASTDRMRALAGRFDDTTALAAWIRTLPQRNDDGDLADGPRVACDVSQRARLAPDDPNCVERSLLYLSAAEVLDSVPVRQLATIDTPGGRHTFPIEDGEPVVLDPAVTRNALNAGLYLIRQGREPEADLTAADPADLLPWIAEVAEEPAAAEDGAKGVARVRRARRIFRAVLAGQPATPDALSDVLYTLTQAEKAAPLFGRVARSAVRLARAALMTLASATPPAPRNGCGCASVATAPVPAPRNAPPDPVDELDLRNFSLGGAARWVARKGAQAYGLGSVYDLAEGAIQKRVQRPKAVKAAPVQPGPPVPALTVAAAPPSPNPRPEPPPDAADGLASLDLMSKGR